MEQFVNFRAAMQHILFAAAKKTLPGFKRTLAYSAQSITKKSRP
jgi:hypothetical protein